MAIDVDSMEKWLVSWMRIGKWYLAPATDPTNEYAAGYDGNVFDSEEEALAAVDGLRALGPEWDIDWVARKY